MRSPEACFVTPSIAFATRGCVGSPFAAADAISRSTAWRAFTSAMGSTALPCANAVETDALASITQRDECDDSMSVHRAKTITTEPSWP